MSRPSLKSLIWLRPTVASDLCCFRHNPGSGRTESLCGTWITPAGRLGAPISPTGHHLCAKCLAKTKLEPRSTPVAVEPVQVATPKRARGRPPGARAAS